MNKQPAIREILRRTEVYLLEKGVDSPRLSAQVLVALGLGVDRMSLFLDLDRPLRESELAAVRPLVARRAKGEPVAYITGRREFFSLEFVVTPDVLIPRPETEMIVEEALRLFGREEPVRFADLGTGSGCLAVTLAVRFPAARGVALDVSLAALAVARENAVRHKVEDRLEFMGGDFADCRAVEDGYGCIVCNPPYVSEEEFGTLSPEVTRFEPRGALVPGVSGLEAFPAVAAVVRKRLAPGGTLLMEIGWKQGQAVKQLLESPEFDFEAVAVLPDLAGHDRVVRARKRSS